MQGGQYLLPCCVRPGGADVFQDGRLKQAVVLEYEGYLIHEHMGIHLFHIHAAHLHCTGGRVPESRNQAGRSGFAAAGGADQRHGLSRLRREGNVGEGGRFRAVIGEAYILKFHPVAMRVLRVCRYFQRWGIHHLLDAAKGGVRPASSQQRRT